jgi:hypothetical protein
MHPAPPCPPRPEQLAVHPSPPHFFTLLAVDPSAPRS